MSLDVKLRFIGGLKGKGDRFCTLIFRGVPATSNVLPGCSGEAFFNEEFYWPLETPLDKDEWLEVRLYNRNKIFQDRLVGAYRLSLAVIADGGSAEVVDNMIDSKHNILRTEVHMEVAYTKPEPGGQLYDYDARSEKKSLAGKSMMSTATGLTRMQHTEEVDLLQDIEIYHPKIRHPPIINSHFSDWMVQIRVIEAKDLAGVSLDPVVCIAVGEQKKTTTVKKQTNNPEWDELFLFDYKCPEQEILDTILTLEVFTGRSIISDGSLIGMFKCDLWYIYSQPDHSFFSKWAPLLDGSTTEIKGYLRLDLQVFGKGDVVKDPPPRKEDPEIDQNLILPPKINPYRPVYQYQIKIYAAAGIPQMNTTLMANMKKAFTKKMHDMADPFVEVTFAGITAKTEVQKNTYNPEFNQLITFTEFFPPLCKRIKLQLKDSDVTSNEVIGTHFIDLDEISNKGQRNKGGFMPMYGPCWVNLYGSTRDYGLSDEHMDLSNGLGEGIAYRGRVLIWLDCLEAEPDDTGLVSVEDCDPLPPKVLGRDEVYQLFSTFYEASMIPRKIGDKPIQFEVTIGEYGFLMKDAVKEEKKQAKNKKDQDIDSIESIDEDEIYQQEKVFVHSLTPPIKPVAPEKKYFHVPFGSDKPCTHIKFPFEDQRRRHYNSVLLNKIHNILEENLEELDERVRIGLPRTNKLLKKVMGDIVHHCSLYIELADGKKTATHLGKNKLDKERVKMCIVEVKSVSVEAAGIAEKCSTDDDMEQKVKHAHSLLRKIRAIIKEPQHGLPDIFVWMISNSKRVAYTRIPAEEILYSKVDSERGLNCGRVQTIFLRLPGKMGHGENGWAIQAKIEARFWLGLLKSKSEYLKDAPSGFETDEDALSTLAVPPTFLRYTEKQKFTVRAHLYQARSLIGSDDSGLSDAFCRCVVTYKPQDTHVIWETRSPTWDCMLKYVDIELWGDVQEFVVNPPVIVLEIFDKDAGGSEEFIGRALAKPVVKLAEEIYEKPFFPPVLQWFPIYRGEMRAGELLGAFELLQVSDDLFTELPTDPEPEERSGAGMIMSVPEDIRPKMQKHRIEVMFWGVREIKKVQFMSVNRPQAQLDCCYKVTKQTGEEEEIVKSVVVKNAKKNPNFEDSVDIFDVYLPENEKYLPPMTIHINDCRAFGRQVLCGTHVIDTLHRFFMDPKLFEPRRPPEEPEDPKKKAKAEAQADMAVDMETPENTPREGGSLKKKKKGEGGQEEEEVLDWWTRFYETLRDMEDDKPKKKKLKLGKLGKGPQDAEQADRAKIPRITIYMDELENIPGFNAFTDFMQSFNLLRGKKTDDEDDEVRRFSGKFKGNIRVWEYPLPHGFDTEDDMGTYYKLPSNELLNVLVRVYVVRCLNLHPMDPNGKADPYLICSLGKKVYKDKDKYVSKQLSPEFGRCFEFDAVIPFDNMVKIQVFDWDMLSGDDLIGETEVDIENLFYSKHRPSCGIQKNYVTHGYAKWRDPQRPASILTKLCKEYGIDGPYFNEGTCNVGGKIYTADAVIIDEKGKEKESDEPVALEALHNFQDLAPKGFHLVPEYVETRSLFNSEKPDIEMGKVQMWIDMFPMDLTMPGPPVNIEVRKPVEYELRIVVWNTEDVLPDETNIITGESSSDQFIKGWLEGNREDMQETDVHYRSYDGSAMFNWRFVFPFKFHKAEEKIVTFKKASIFSVDLTEEKHKPLLYLQVWDADLFSSDDFIGDAILSLTKLPSPAKTAKSCDLEMLEPGKPTASIFKIKKCRGWWPFQVNPEDDDDPNPILAGKVDVEIELLTKEDAEAAPAGRKREEPQPLEKPNRPNDSFFSFMGPLTMLRYLIWEPYKWLIMKLMVISLLLMILGLFLYSMPGYTIKKVFGA